MLEYSQVSDSLLPNRTVWYYSRWFFVIMAGTMFVFALILSQPIATSTDTATKVCSSVLVVVGLLVLILTPRLSKIKAVEIIDDEMLFYNGSGKKILSRVPRAQVESYRPRGGTERCNAVYLRDGKSIDIGVGFERRAEVIGILKQWADENWHDKDEYFRPKL